MGRSPCCDKGKVRKGPWSIEEDRLLRNFIMKYGNGGNWISLPKKAGLNRCGKSCRLRWLNYLRPGINHNDFTEEEDRVIYTLYHTIGSRWSVIASNLQRRTDNDVKNYWNTKLKKKIMEGKFKNFNPTTNTIKQSLRKSEEMDFEMDQNQFHLHPEINNGDQISAMEESEEEKETKNNLVSHAICSHEESLSSFGCYDNQNSSSFASIISELSSFDDQSSNDQDDFWLDLLSGSSEDVIFSIQLEEKMIEMASLLDV